MARHAADALSASKAAETILVTGHEPDDVKRALEGVKLRAVHNAEYESGLASSLRTGLAAVPHDADGVVIALADMPLVRARDIDRLIAAFNPAEHRSICVPAVEGRRGNPVLWGRQHFAALAKLEGDKGARSLMYAYPEEIVEVAFAGDAVLTDYDTPDSLKA
jgi:molybdenum cofactor cytidylyltransferase